MFFLQRFGILSEETSGVLLAIEMQTCNKERLFCFLLLVSCVAVSIPRCRQGLGPVVVQKPLQRFLPAELAQDILVEFGPVFAKDLVKGRQ